MKESDYEQGTAVVRTFVNGLPSDVFAFAKEYLPHNEVVFASVVPMKEGRFTRYDISLASVSAKEMKLADFWLSYQSEKLSPEQISMAEQLQRLLFRSCQDRRLLPVTFVEQTLMLEVSLAFDLEREDVTRLGSSLRKFELLGWLKPFVAYRSNPEVPIAFRPLPDWGYPSAAHEAEIELFGRYLPGCKLVELRETLDIMRLLYRKKFRARQVMITDLAKRNMWRHYQAFLSRTDKSGVKYLDQLDKDWIYKRMLDQVSHPGS